MREEVHCYYRPCSLCNGKIVTIFNRNCKNIIFSHQTGISWSVCSCASALCGRCQFLNNRCTATVTRRWGYCKQQHPVAYSFLPFSCHVKEGRKEGRCLLLAIPPPPPPPPQSPGDCGSALLFKNWLLLFHDFSKEDSGITRCV